MKRNDRYPLRDKIKYILNSFIAKGFGAQILLLAGTSFVLTLLFGVVVMNFGEPEYGEAYWAALMHMLDQGTITADEFGTDSYFMFMLLVTFVGMAITGSIVAIITATIQGKMDNLRKGHSSVVERGHVVILGFDGNTGTICSEILEGGKNRGERVCLVVADDLPAEDMEQHLKEFRSKPLMPDNREAKNSRLKVIIRSGDLVSENTFSICAAENAKAILICRENDMETIRIILALAMYLKKRGAYIGDDAMPEIIALIHDEKNMPAAMDASGLDLEEANNGRINGNKIRILNDMEIMGRYLAQTCVQQGFPYVLDGLFNPVKNSIFIEKRSNSDGSPFLGKTLPEITAMVENAIPLGYIRRKDGKPDSILLNPLKTDQYRPEDRLIYLSDGPKLKTGERETTEPVGKALVTEDNNKKRRSFLIAGQSETLPDMLKNLSAYCTENSEIQRSKPLDWETIKCIFDRNSFWFDKSHERRLTNIVLFSPAGENRTSADEKVITLLLNIRRYLKDRDAEDVSITSELQLPQNQMMVMNKEINDFVVASEISNHMMTQLLDDPAKYCIIKNLLRPESDLIQLNPLSDYVDTSYDFNFEGVFTSAVERGDATGRAEIPVGWIKLNGEEDSSIVLNPQKDDLELIYPAGDYGNYRLVALSGLGYFVTDREDE